MSAIAQASRPVSLNRRRRVRQKVHAPAYASFSGASRSEMLDLHEVLNISEIGVSVQCPSPMEIGQQLDMCLDLVEASGQISVTARVMWSDSTGRAGLGFPALVGPARQRLREWLFLNAMASASNAASSAALPRSIAPTNSTLRPNYTDTLSAASAVQREAESLGSDLEAVLCLVASRSQSLLRASGAAIALPASNPGLMICRASAGPIAPPVGTNLQVGSGFSGECVRTGRMLRCDDAETDVLADRESCRALGIRSMLAAPVRMGEKVIGLIEVFSAEAGAFGENDSTVLQRFAETILAAIKRAARESLTPPASKPFVAQPGSVLFAYPPEESKKKDEENDENENEHGQTDREIEMGASADDDDDDKVGGIRLPLANLYLLIGTAATIFLVLGFLLAPWIQPWIQRKFQGRERGGEQTVLASSKAPADAVKSDLAADSGNLDQLLTLARRGDPAAENAVGLLYAEGDEKQAVIPDEAEAARWFTSAAEHGNVPAQSKLGSLYWSGRGVPQDSNRAYFWTVLARASGDEASKALAPFIAARLTLAQRAAIEQQAEQWLQQHESTKPQAGH